MRHSIKLTLSTLESDSYNNVFQVRMPFWEAKKRLEYFDANNIEVSNRKEVEAYIKKGESHA